jgi:hypothetical protein
LSLSGGFTEYTKATSRYMLWNTRSQQRGRSPLALEGRLRDRERRMVPGRASGLLAMEARHSREWCVLAGFWREKAGAGRVPSFISGCAVAKMLEGVFSRIIRVA